MTSQMVPDHILRLAIRKREEAQLLPDGREEKGYPLDLWIGICLQSEVLAKTIEDDALALLNEGDAHG